jgi:predicted DNA-binding ribbon-helix-helix protein
LTKEISAVIKMVLDSLIGRLMEAVHPVVEQDQALTSAAEVICLEIYDKSPFGLGIGS